MMKVPEISASRVVEVYREMKSCRRGEYADTDFFRMTDVWSNLIDEEGLWRIKFFDSQLGEDYRRKAGVVSFGDRLTLTVDRELWRRGEKGELFANFVLAHELGHIALGHHARSATTKNFKTVQSASGLHSVVPPNAEELEADLAAVFFQCGALLLDLRWNIHDLARRARTDIRYSEKARLLLLSPEVQKELNKTRGKVSRVIL